MTIVTGAFCSALQVTDVRYDLSVYGEFFKGIPRRLGTSTALDASARALTTAFASVQSRRKSQEVYLSYAEALKAVRVCLNDSVEVGSANTMCAIYMIMICQVSVVFMNVDAKKLILNRAGLASMVNAPVMGKYWHTC